MQATVRLRLRAICVLLIVAAMPAFAEGGQVRGGNAQGNAVIVRAVLTGEKGPKRDVVLLNSAYALLAAGKVAAVAEGIKTAAEAIDSGRALAQIEKLAQLTNQ